jgi:hypothetical protein
VFIPPFSPHYPKFPLVIQLHHFFPFGSGGTVGEDMKSVAFSLLTNDMDQSCDSHQTKSQFRHSMDFAKSTLAASSALNFFCNFVTTMARGISFQR